ncbi:hypothetical protein JFY47_05685 [Enterobacter asburiae]|uniref:hypothetical protein n=1 Tax=Enterobacter asburiae TaxID=61645 RepID=UPI0018E94BDB|nr:hypothetical protein [Enterobacter asburiae]MBJ3780027.1 hypothetical protein [Enterobacter asburiae]
MSKKAGEIYYDIEADVSGLLKAQGKANKSLDSIGNSATNAAKKWMSCRPISTILKKRGERHRHSCT